VVGSEKFVENNKAVCQYHVPHSPFWRIFPPRATLISGWIYKFRTICRRLCRSNDVAKGEEHRISVIGDPPQQSYTSSAGIVELSWYDSAWLHLGILFMFDVFSSNYFVVASKKEQGKSYPFKASLVCAYCYYLWNCYATLFFRILRLCHDYK